MTRPAGGRLAALRVLLRLLLACFIIALTAQAPSLVGLAGRRVGWGNLVAYIVLPVAGAVIGMATIVGYAATREDRLRQEIRRLHAERDQDSQHQYTIGFRDGQVFAAECPRAER